MTKEEAIKWIKEHHCTDLDGCKDSTAMKMAVEALQREIDFDNATAAAYDYGYDCGYEVGYSKGYNKGVMETIGVLE